MARAVVREIRSGLEESIHLVDISVVDPDGRTVAHAGDPHRPIFARSSMKPLQAAVSLSFAPYDFDDREIAVMCASHNAEPIHLEAVRSLMARAGVEETALQTPAARPWDDEALGADPERRTINSDCSGKHGGMLAACRAQGWPEATYRRADHPLQAEVLAAVRTAAGQEPFTVGVDGCGVPVHGLPLTAMATIYARLATPERLGPWMEPARRAGAAMRAAPYYVAGRNRVDTALMEAREDILVKSGAEGLACAALLEAGLGVAVKARDGSPRAPGPALIAALADLGFLDQAQIDAVAAFARPAVLGGGRPAGHLAAEVELDRS